MDRTLRGDEVLPESEAPFQVVLIELFAGILPATAALHALQIRTATYFSEVTSDPIEIAAKHWPAAIPLGDVLSLSDATLREIVDKHPGALILVTGGIPCVDVSKLNKFGRGCQAQQTRSKLAAAAHIVEFLKAISNNVAFIFECTRMKLADRQAFTGAFGVEPIEINNVHFAPLTRPRWWWIGGKAPNYPSRIQSRTTKEGVKEIRPVMTPMQWKDAILPGYRPCSLDDGLEVRFACLTTRKARTKPGDAPVGLDTASPAAIQRWAADAWSQSPYNFESSNMVRDKNGSSRRLLPCEEEVLMGYPWDYTAHLSCIDKKDAAAMRLRRQTLLGNSWSMHVTLFLMQAVVAPHVSLDRATGNSAKYDLAPKAFAWGRANCPYILDMKGRNMVIPCVVPPDWAEQHAHTASSLAENVQSRKHTTFHLDKAMLSVGPTASLPRGLPPAVHFVAGSEAESPLETTPMVPDDMDFAQRKTMELGDGADAWRAKQLRAMVEWMDSAPGLKAFWSSWHTDNSKDVAPGVFPHKIDLLNHSMLWPDGSLPAMTAVGACPLGGQIETGTFKAKVTEATLSMQDFADNSAGYMADLLSRPPPSEEQRTKIFELTEKEIELELLTGYYTAEEMNAKYGLGGWRALPRYAICQGGKWRLIDNGKAGQHNHTFASLETIHTTSTAAGVAVAANFRRLNKGRLRGSRKLRVSSQDMWKAYRQIPGHAKQRKWMVVMVYHPIRKMWVFGEAKGLLFGLTGSVLHFNRVPAFITAVARRWLALPVQHYFDDFRLFDVKVSRGSVNKYFKLLLDAVIGYRIDPAKESIPAPMLTFLGNVEDYDPKDEDDAVQLRPKEGRAATIEASVDEAIRDEALQEGAAKTLNGKMLHFAATSAGRFGKGILYHVADRAAGTTPVWYENLLFNLVFIKYLLGHNIPRTITLRPDSSAGVRLWTDASYSDEAGCKLCAIIKPRPPRLPQGIVMTVPPSVVAIFVQRKQQIHMGELLAPMMALLRWPELMENESTINYIDNMGVLCNIVGGSSRAPDAGTLIFALHLRMAKLKVRSWWEWVESESNCSDGGSRVGVLCPVAAALGIPLVEHPFPFLPVGFMTMMPEEWDRWWIEQRLW